MWLFYWDFRSNDMVISPTQPCLVGTNYLTRIPGQITENYLTDSVRPSSDFLIAIPGQTSAGYLMDPARQSSGGLSDWDSRWNNRGICTDLAHPSSDWLFDWSNSRVLFTIQPCQAGTDYLARIPSQITEDYLTDLVQPRFDFFDWGFPAK